MKARIVKKRFRDCKFDNWTTTRVLEITFKQWDERVVTQLKNMDWVNEKSEKIAIESLRQAAEKYFNNLITEKALEASKNLTNKD